MKIRCLLILLATADLFLSCKTDVLNTEDKEDVLICDNSADPGLQQGMSYVRFTEDAAARIRKEGAEKVLGDAMEALGVTRISPVFEDSKEFHERHMAEGLDRWYCLEYAPEMAVTKAGSTLEALPGVDHVEEARKVESCSVKLPFNDPGAALHQWHLYNDGTLVSGFAAGADINVVPVWKGYTTGSSNVIVAVLDSGADETCADLNGVVIPGGENGSKNFLTYYASTPYVIHPENHGTHVAGLIGAINNNGIGGCGVAGGSNGKGGVKILNCQFLGTDPTDNTKSLSGSSSAALVWAADHGAVIANNSWSSVYSAESAVPDYPSALTMVAFDYFIKYAGIDENGNQTGPMKGGVAIIAAGNNGWSRAQPAMYEPLIAVGACGPAFERATYSNYGDWVDICAPGGNKTPYSSNDAMIYSCGTGTSYWYMQGTSQSCPLVSGVAALLVSQFGGQGFTNTQLKELLLSGANTKVESKQDKPIGPLVDAAASFALMSAEVPQVTDLKGTVRDKGLTLVWTILADGSSPTYSYVAAISSSRSAIENLKLSSVSSSVMTKTIVTSSKKVGAKTTALFTGLTNRTTYYCTVFGVNSVGIASPKSNIISLTPVGNDPPMIFYEDSRNMATDSYGTVKVTYSVTDPDGDRLLISTDAGSSYASWSSTEDNMVTLFINGKDAEPGTYTATLSVSDGNGGTCSKEVKYTIADNHMPIIESGIS